MLKIFFYFLSVPFGFYFQAALKLVTTLENEFGSIWAETKMFEAHKQ